MMQRKKVQKFSEQFINFNSQVIQLNQSIPSEILTVYE